MIRHLLKLVWKRKAANGLLILEIFCSFLVLFAVATIGSAMASRYRRPLGFDYRNVWLLRVGTLSNVESTPEVEAESWKTVERMIRELEAMPEVEAVAATLSPVYTRGAWTSTVTDEKRRITFDRDLVTDDYAKALRIPIVSGRWFSAEDRGAKVPPAVIDTDVAREFFGSEDPVGRVVELNHGDPVRIVGVVAQFRRRGEFSADRTNMWFSRGEADQPGSRAPRNLLVRIAEGTPADFEQTLVDRLGAVDPESPVHVQNLAQTRRSINRAMLAPVIIAGVLGLFLVSMVVLGLSGVLWQNVTRRTRELGLRRALGASGGDVSRQIVIEVALLVTFAVIVGLVVIGQLPVIGIFDFITPAAYATGLGVALVTIYALALAAALYPGLLASRVTPADALRWE